MKLSEQQDLAVNNIVTWVIEGTSTSRVLKGFAGTGKSTVVSYIINELRKHDEYAPIFLCAPTNKACRVLQEKTGEEVITLHKLLNLSVSVELEHFNPNSLIFRPYKEPSLPDFSLVIVDECSMVNRSLFEYLKELCDRTMSKILFVGDPAQLPPVGEKISITFEIEGDELTKVFRTDSTSILKVCSHIRENLKTSVSFQEFFDERFEQIEFNNMLDMIPTYYDRAFKSKYIAFTNNRVTTVNRRIREILFNTNDMFIVGDSVMPIRTGPSRITGNSSISNEQAYYNSEDLKVLNVDEGEFILRRKVAPIIFKCYDLKCLSTDNIIKHIQVLHPDEYNRFLDFYNALVIEAKDEKDKKTRGEKWSVILNLQNDLLCLDTLESNYLPSKYFTSITYGYAITTHRSQGSTYQNVFVDVSNMYKVSELWTRNRMFYVAISRAANKVFLLS